MPKKNCNENKVDIAVLDTRVKSVESFVENMNKNHLPHIYAKLTKIEIRMAYYIGGASVVVVIAQILANKFL